MKTTIYYFSGTGNSFVIAKKLAEILNGECDNISSLMCKAEITADADVIGIIYPVYNHIIPFIIKRFVEKLGGTKGKYIFGVCTYGDQMCLSLEFLKKELERHNGKLSAGFGIHMPYNYITPSFTLKNFYGSFTLREIPVEKQDELFKEADEKLLLISEYIKAGKTGTIETSMRIVETLIDIVGLRETTQKNSWLRIAGYQGKTNLPLIESIQLMDYGFRCDDKCVGCRKCKMVCPVDNIDFYQERPGWKHHCEQCMACLHWCPTKAIQFGTKMTGKRRYQHPRVRLVNGQMELI